MNPAETTTVKRLIADAIAAERAKLIAAISAASSKAQTGEVTHALRALLSEYTKP